MCFYITTTLPKDTKIDDIRPIFDKYEMAFSEIHNPTVESQLRPGELYFRATKSYCDCDTALGSRNNLQLFQQISKSKKVKTLKKKNWSEEEINTWIKEKVRKKLKKKGKNKNSLEIKNETNKWIDFMKSLLDNKLVSRIGIIKHWYEQGIEDEEFKITDIQRINVNKITPDLLLNLGENILYEFFPV
jgi:hypothetical protein